MSEKPRRGSFPIHFSTVITVMFVAGGLVWQSYETMWQIIETTDPASKLSPYRLADVVGRGFPVPFRVEIEKPPKPVVYSYSVLGLTIDVLFVVAISAFAGWLVEKLTRLFAPRRP